MPDSVKSPKIRVDGLTRSHLQQRLDGRQANNEISHASIALQKDSTALRTPVTTAGAQTRPAREARQPASAPQSTPKVGPDPNSMTTTISHPSLPLPSASPRRGHRRSFFLRQAVEPFSLMRQQPLRRLSTYALLGSWQLILVTVLAIAYAVGHAIATRSPTQLLVSAQNFVQGPRYYLLPLIFGLLCVKTLVIGLWLFLIRRGMRATALRLLDHRPIHLRLVWHQAVSTLHLAILNVLGNFLEISLVVILVSVGIFGASRNSAWASSTLGSICLAALALAAVLALVFQYLRRQTQLSLASSTAANVRDWQKHSFALVRRSFGRLFAAWVVWLLGGLVTLAVLVLIGWAWVSYGGLHPLSLRWLLWLAGYLLAAVVIRAWIGWSNAYWAVAHHSLVMHHAKLERSNYLEPHHSQTLRRWPLLVLVGSSFGLFVIGGLIIFASRSTFSHQLQNLRTKLPSAQNRVIPKINDKN